MVIRHRAAAFAALILAPGLFAGCLADAIRQNQQQLDAQKVEIDKLVKEVEALKTQQAHSYASAPAPPGSCDMAIARRAIDLGAAKAAAHDLDRASGYYQDALIACPANVEAKLDLAKTYEALGNRDKALDYYRQASQSNDIAAADAIREAGAALTRLKAGN